MTTTIPRSVQRNKNTESPHPRRLAPKKTKPSGRKNLSRWQLITLRILFGLLLVAGWQMSVSIGLINESIVSTPANVAVYLSQALIDPTFWYHLLATVQAVVIAFVLASVVGIIAGLGLGLLPNLEKVVSPYIEAINAMPRIALAPVFVVAFGISTSAKIALAFSIVVFLVLSGARAGVQSADVDILRLSNVLGLNKIQMFFKILLPIATPSIFGALRLGIIYSLLGVVTAEMLASRNGIGQMLQEYAGLYRSDGIIGLLIVLAVVATTINMLAGAIERRLLRWQSEAK